MGTADAQKIPVSEVRTAWGPLDTAAATLMPGHPPATPGS
jgi:hypothetical protein